MTSRSPLPPGPYGHAASAAVDASSCRQAVGPGVAEFPLEALDRTGVPVWAAWHRGGTAGGRATVGIAAGTSDGEARARALARAVGRVASLRTVRWTRPVEGSRAELAARHGSDGIVDPRELGIPAGAPYDDDRPLQWLPMRRIRDGMLVLVPADVVAGAPGDLAGRPPTGGRLLRPTGTGTGVGSTPGSAVTDGLLSVLRRDGTAWTSRALDAGVEIDLGGVDDPGTVSVLGLLAAAGVDVVAKLAATDLGLTTVVVVGAAPADGVLAASAYGEGAHPEPGVALREAVLDYAAARARAHFLHGPLAAAGRIAPPGYLDAALEEVDLGGEDQRVLMAMVDRLRSDREEWQPLLERLVLARRITLPFAALPGTDGPTVDRVHAAGLDVLVADLTPGLLAEAGVHAVRVVVPGADGGAVPDGRLVERGVVRLLRQGRHDLVRIGTAPRGWARVRLTGEAQERLGGPAWLDRTALDRAVEGLLPLYREPGRHAVQQVIRPELPTVPLDPVELEAAAVARELHAAGTPTLLVLEDATEGRQPRPAGPEEATRRDGERLADLLETYRQHLRPGSTDDDHWAVHDVLVVLGHVHGPVQP